MLLSARLAGKLILAGPRSQKTSCLVDPKAGIGGRKAFAFIELSCHEHSGGKALERGEVAEPG